MLYLVTIFIFLALGVSIVYSIYKNEAPKQAEIWKEIEETLKKSQNIFGMNHDGQVNQTQHQKINEAVLCQPAANDEKFPQQEQRKVPSKPSSVNVVRAETIPLMVKEMNVLLASHRSMTVASSVASASIRKAAIRSRLRSDDLGFPNFGELDMVPPYSRSTLSDDFTKVSVTHS